MREAEMLPGNQQCHWNQSAKSLKIDQVNLKLERHKPDQTEMKPLCQYWRPLISDGLALLPQPQRDVCRCEPQML